MAVDIIKEESIQKKKQVKFLAIVHIELFLEWKYQQ